jgi:hypothetical protein
MSGAFFDVKNAADLKSSGFCSGLRVSNGEVLILRVFLDNDAPDTLAKAGEAKDVRLSLNPDTEISALQHVRAEITASNAIPSLISATVELGAGQPFRLDLVSGSGRVYTTANPNPGLSLTDAVWRGSAPLGYMSLDGNILPGYQYALLAVVQVRVTFVVA